MIKTICHTADIHIRKLPTRHQEYREVFDRLYKSIKEKNPDRILICGDLFHDRIDLQGEAVILASEFLNKLSTIAPLRIIRGNHDFLATNKKRIDSIEAIVKTIDNPNIIYYNKTGFHEDENVTWAVWHHGEKNNSPWVKEKKHVKKQGQTYIDLFHDPINGALSDGGYEFKSKVYNKLNNFKGEYSLFGDIHGMQLFSNKTKGYSGSLIAQNFAEGDDRFHGYLLWNIEKNAVEQISIHNDYSFHTIKVNPYTDFDDLEIEIDNPTQYMKIRVLWQTLPATRNKVNERKIIKYLNDKYHPLFISHKNEFLEEDSYDENQQIDVTNITDQSVQHDIFKNYLEKIGVKEDIVDEVIKLDEEISSRMQVEEFTNITWDIVKFSVKNFMSYQNFEIDWKDKNGLYQVTGLNRYGKTTIFKALTYILYNKTLETETRVKFGDIRYINNIIDVDHCEGTIVININGEYFGIKRKTNVEKNKSGEIKAVPTTLQYYKLSTPDDKFTDDNSIDKLNDTDKKKTQVLIEKAIGSYDNFKRVVMTTSDTLNKILSNDKSEFIDSLLYDSGLDIFDLKSNTFKQYQKELSKLERFSCDVNKSKENIENLENEKKEIELLIENIETNKIPDLDKRIKKGEEYVEILVKKLYKIDEKISNLNVEETKKEIEIHHNSINEYNSQKERLTLAVSSLIETYDKEEYERLLKIKEEHKTNEYNLKSKIKEFENNTYHHEREIEQINGKIHLLKNEGSSYKEEIFNLKNSKKCPTCGQELSDEHKHHTDEKIKEVEKKMYNTANLIKQEQKNILTLKESIESNNININQHESLIKEQSIKMDDVLHKIGEISNQINDIEKRKQLISDIDKIPPQIEILELKINNLENNINLYNQSLIQINENKKINAGILKAKEKLNVLKQELSIVNDNLYNNKIKYSEILTKIKQINELIINFEKQERQDRIFTIYKKCIHRDGIPTQLLKTYAIPKINNGLDDLLMNIDFNIWLDEYDLKLKLAPNNRPDAVIDAIAGSGKERTFASVALKFALNQINCKSKPTLFLLDEVMGKLIDESVNEFLELLNLIKERINNVLIVEHNHYISYDYLINVSKDENDISKLTIE